MIQSWVRLKVTKNDRENNGGGKRVQPGAAKKRLKLMEEERVHHLNEFIWERFFFLTVGGRRGVCQK